MTRLDVIAVAGYTVGLAIGHPANIVVPDHAPVYVHPQEETE